MPLFVTSRTKDDKVFEIVVRTVLIHMMNLKNGGVFIIFTVETVVWIVAEGKWSVGTPTFTFVVTTVAESVKVRQTVKPLCMILA